MPKARLSQDLTSTEAAHVEVKARPGKKQGPSTCLHEALDFSGSYRKCAEIISKASDGNFERLRAKKDLLDSVLRCRTEMSGIVETTGYYPLTETRTLPIKPGSTSPQHLWLRGVVRSETQLAESYANAADLPRRFVVMAGDGIPDHNTADEVKKALAEFQEAQRTLGFEVYPVVLGTNADMDFMAAISLTKKPFVIEDIHTNAHERVLGFYDTLFKFTSGVAEGSIDPDRMQSMDPAELYGAKLEG